ncbi:MAG: hypothetical protein R3D88_04540 [Alphaproteobacteria bacterium]|nr:hypothetical protein [Alphaproteobacteria bacterium]
MATSIALGDLVSDAVVLGTLDNSPPPMDFHGDFRIPVTQPLQTDVKINADFEFLNKGPAP